MLTHAHRVEASPFPGRTVGPTVVGISFPRISSATLVSAFVTGNAWAALCPFGKGESVTVGSDETIVKS